MPSSTRRQKPGRPARLSAEMIVDTALALVQRSHLSQVTMRALADELGATPMAIYKHVQGRDELELLVVTRSFAALKLPSLELEAIEWLRRVAVQVRAIGLTYPGVMDYLLDHGPVAEPALRIFDRTVTCLHVAGLGYREAGELHNTFFSWLAGSVRRQHAAQAAEPEAFASFLSAARALPAAEYPGLQRALTHMKTVNFDREWKTSLQLLLDAIELRITRSRSG